MADNITLSTNIGSGAVVAAQDEASVYYQEIKLTASGTGTTEALSKAEDSAHSSGEHGIMALSVRQNTAASTSGADGDYQPLITDTNGRLHVIDISTAAALSGSEFQVDVVAALPAGTNAIGKLAANSGVDIGDVDVLSIIPGTGATNLGKAEDAAHSNGDVGVMPLAVRRDADTTLAASTNDYAPLIVDANGYLKVEIFDGGGSHTVDNGGTFAVQSTLQAGTAEFGKLAAGTAEIGNVKNAGTFVTQVDGSALTALQLIDNIVVVEDAAHGSGDSGVMALAVRNDTLATLGGSDGDYAPLQVNDEGALYIIPQAYNLGGCKYFSSNDIDQTEEDVSAGACTVYSMYFWNSTAAPLWAQIFNTNTVTVGTTVPIMNFIIPANADSDGAGVVIPIPACGLAFSTALTVAVTTGVGTNNGAPGANAAGCIICYED